MWKHRNYLQNCNFYGPDHFAWLLHSGCLRISILIRGLKYFSVAMRQGTQFLQENNHMKQLFNISKINLKQNMIIFRLGGLNSISNNLYLFPS